MKLWLMINYVGAVDGRRMCVCVCVCVWGGGGVMVEWSPAWLESKSFVYWLYLLVLLNFPLNYISHHKIGSDVISGFFVVSLVEIYFIFPVILYRNGIQETCFRKMGTIKRKLCWPEGPVLVYY